MTKNANFFQVALADINTSFTYNSTNAIGSGVFIPKNILQQAASTENSGSNILVAIVHYFNDILFPSSENVSNVSDFRYLMK